MTNLLGFITRTLEQMEHECGPEYPFVKYLRSRVHVLEEAGSYCKSSCNDFVQDNEREYADRLATLDARVAGVRDKYRTRHDQLCNELRGLHQ